MRKLLLTPAVAGAACLAFAPVALAAKWTGTATNPEGNFNYGKVTFTTSGSTMKKLVIRGVTTSGCGGFKDVVVPKLKIRGGKFTGTYVPVPGSNDVIRVRGTIRGSTARGQFSEGPLDFARPPVCQNKGRFTASRG